MAVHFHCRAAWSIAPHAVLEDCIACVHIGMSSGYTVLNVYSDYVHIGMSSGYTVLDVCSDYVHIGNSSGYTVLNVYSDYVHMDESGQAVTMYYPYAHG